MCEAGTLRKISDELTQPASQPGIGLVPDFRGEDRREFVEKLAYQHWEARGRPIGPSDVDWFAPPGRQSAHDILLEQSADRALRRTRANASGSFVARRSSTQLQPASIQIDNPGLND
jgi:hypothetical protein